MALQFRVLLLGTCVAAILGLVYTSGSSQAAGDGKDIPATVKKIADQIKAGNDGGAKKTAAAAAKNIEELADLMHMFRPRNKGGLGIGESKMANPSKDGIEVYFRDLAHVPGGIAKQADSLELTGYWIAAMGELSIAKAPTKAAGKKQPKAWIGFSTDMRVAGIGFAKAAAGKGAKEIKTAAAKVNASCNGCHSIFKE